MDILHNFGFDPMLFVAQVINFLIILFVLKKLVYKPVLTMLNKRDKEIRDGLKNKEDADLLLEKAQAKEAEILQKAQEKADKMVADAKTEATKTKVEIEENARAEAAKMIAQAKETIEQETKAAEERLTAKIGSISISLLEKSLTGIFGKKEQEVILKRAEAEIRKQRV